MIGLSNFNSLIELASYFNSEAKCRKVIREQRWGKDIACPVCGSLHVYDRKNGRYTFFFVDQSPSDKNVLNNLRSPFACLIFLTLIISPHSTASIYIDILI